MSGRGRPEIDARDYFLDQQRKNAIADRRPVIRRASDLVGPGIRGSAVRLTDFSDLLATFDGFFSAVDALNGPEPDSGTGLDPSSYVGWVSSDAELGGVQLFVNLLDGARWQRTFRRNPLDASAIYWSAWTSLT